MDAVSGFCEMLSDEHSFDCAVVVLANVTGDGNGDGTGAAAGVAVGGVDFELYCCSCCCCSFSNLCALACCNHISRVFWSTGHESASDDAATGGWKAGICDVG